MCFAFSSVKALSAVLSHLDVENHGGLCAERICPSLTRRGFSPRPIMSYGYALPVGILSEAEYGDFVFARKIDPDEFVVRYNQHLPQGFRVLRAERVRIGRQL